jgi:ubiquitin-protein ligase
MGIPNEQLRKIFQDLKETFDRSPFISIIPFDDDPPEKYEIRYSIPGLIQNEYGDIVESREHSVFINIPFGFPHFPPSCTPQSATFHPDFDQAAICIGEFWNKDRTLPELIIHIGKMICGETFSTENAFNESAVAWYTKISHQLPFEKIDFTATTVHEEDVDFDEDLLSDGMDTLDDADITSHSDYLSVKKTEEDDTEFSLPTRAQESGKNSVNRVYLLIRQKRFAELAEFLQDLPEDAHFEDREDIERKISTLMQKVKKMQKEGDEQEHQGNPQAALDLFERVADIVPDFPNIEESIERTKSSVELESDSWESDYTAQHTDAEQADSGKKAKRRVAFFEESSKTTFKLLPILGGILVIILAFIFITPMFSAKSSLQTANQLYGQCNQFLERNQFRRAETECKRALQTLKKITLYQTTERDSLQRQIQLTLGSEKMEQGLAGRVKFQGKYVEKDNMEKVREFHIQVQKANTYFDKSLWKKAIGLYIEALKTAQPISESFEKVLLQEIRDKIQVAQINLSIKRGISLLSRSELEMSRQKFSSALEEAQKLPEELGGQLLARIKPKLREIKYLQHLDLGKKFFDANDWESAILQYEKALQLRGASAVATSDEETASLYSNMAEAELFTLITSARDSFSQSEWQNAISYYQKAIRLVYEKRELLNRIDPDAIQQQLKRIILRARIVQHKQKADQELNTQEYNKAILAYNKVIDVVQASGQEGDKEFKAIIQGTQETIEKTRAEAAIAQRIQYLENNYKTIFAENYSAAIPEYLSAPKATFLRYIDGKELYEIQCLESNRGRKLRLVMLYSYDPARDMWKFYSKTQD